jgi:hypothetical protein
MAAMAIAIAIETGATQRPSDRSVVTGVSGKDLDVVGEKEFDWARDRYAPRAPAVNPHK